MCIRDSPESDDTFEEGFSPRLDLKEDGGSGQAPRDGDSFAASVENGAFVSPEGERRVVTASGKVIETETELLQKRIEKKRAQAAETADGVSPESVGAEIAKKEAAVDVYKRQARK